MSHPRVASVLFSALLLLSGCGGGGGDGGSSPPPAQGGGGTTPPPVAPTAAVGSVWHSDADIGDTQGTFVTRLDTGASTRVLAERWAVPSADGSRLLRRAYTSQGSTGDETRITVNRASDGQLLTDLVVDGYAGDLTPSPQNADLVMAPWAPSINGQRNTVVYDLAQRKLLYATQAAAKPDALSWLPDGAVLRVTATGEISKLVPGGQEQRLGTVAWPEARTLQAVYASPDGSKALVQLAALRATGTVSGVDLWMVNVDGSGLRRFTKNDLIANALWSQDGKHVAFTKDTGVNCTEATCQGSCSVWYAEAGASDVVAVAASQDAKQFAVKRINGTDKTLNCPVMAWTR
ncbi:MAG TPA: hypothetical protein VGE36_11140 [Roseateles sp.]